MTQESALLSEHSGCFKIQDVVNPSNPILVLFGGACAIPSGIDTCPECNASLQAEVIEWETATGRPTTGGIYVDCIADELCQHKYWQSDWQPVIDNIAEYLKAVEN